jgi:hypothetical protein
MTNPDLLTTWIAPGFTTYPAFAGMVAVKYLIADLIKIENWRNPTLKIQSNTT